VASKHPFGHCHWHSTRSALDGYGLETQMADRCAALGHWFAAITDHGNVCGHVRFDKAMRKKGLKPLFGIEAYITDDLTSRTAVNDTLGVNAFPHVTLIASTQKGYENLLRLNRIAYGDGFHKYPRMDWATLARYQEGLTVLSGCPLGYPTRLLENRGVEACGEWLREWSARIERFYVELTPSPGYDVSERTMLPLMRLAHQLGLPTILTGDVHMPTQEDFRAQDVMLAIGTGRQVNDPTRILANYQLYYACDVKTLYNRALETIQAPASVDLLIEDCPVVDVLKEAIRNTGRIAEQCEVELPKANQVFFPKRGDVPADKALWTAVLAGLQRRMEQGLLIEEKWQEYQERCLREWTVLKAKGFCDYILIVADVISTIREKGAVVLTRGSAGGCCLLWALGASVTDPLLHQLSFERFFDDSRSDPPDVDVDFPEAMRPVVMEYVRGLYGAENVAQLGTFGTFGTRQAIKDVGRAFGIDASVLHPVSAALSGNDNDVAGQLDQLTDPKAVAVLRKYPVLRLAEKLIGQMRNAGVHACGVVVDNQPLEGRIGLVRGKDGQLVTAWDKRDVKDLGYLKADFLSVVGLDVMQLLLKLLGRHPDWLETIPLDDPKVYQYAKAGFMAGVFQLDGSSALRVGKDIGLDTFADLCVASALCRPGPLEMVPIYAENKRHPERLRRLLDSMHEVPAGSLEETFGILIYQEQVMRLAHEMCGLPMPEVQVLRKGVSDKLGTQPDKEKADAWKAEWHGKFVGGAVRSGVSSVEAEKWWGQVQTHGGYSFNKSHCYTYGLLGYWMLYCKVHHPAEFYAAYLELEEDPVTRDRLIREFRRLGGEVKVLDPALSRQNTSCPRPGLIVGGYQNLYKCGETTAAKLAQVGPFSSWDELLLACPAGVRSWIELSGLPTGRVNPQALVRLAPWFPVEQLPQNVRDARYKKGWPTVDQLPKGHPWEDGGTTSMMGYISAKEVTPKFVEVLLQDETGAIPVKVSSKRVRTLGPVFREVKVGDLLAVSGWWSGDTLYVNGPPIRVKKCPTAAAGLELTTEEMRSLTQGGSLPVRLKTLHIQYYAPLEQWQQVAELALDRGVDFKQMFLRCLYNGVVLPPVANRLKPSEPEVIRRLAEGVPISHKERSCLDIGTPKEVVIRICKHALQEGQTFTEAYQQTLQWGIEMQKED
jgi:DNA polymerase III subunit alpha